MNGRLKVAVVGVGSLGQHHARVYAQLPDAELVGVYDADPKRAAEIARKNKTTVLGSLDEVASAAEACSVAVPTDLHHDVAMRLLEQGVHLLVEKPIAATMAEAEGMVAQARARSAILQVGHIERFNPVMKFLQGRLNRPRFVEAIRLAPYPVFTGGRARGTEVSVVLDLMIHDLDIILHIVGAPVREVHAVGVAALSSSEDIANVRLSFENQCVANVSASRISREKMRKIRVFQEDAYMSLDYMNQKGVICRRADGSIRVDDVPIEKDEPLRAELAAFVDCVRRRAEPVVDGRHASEALELAMEICRRIRECPS